MKRRLTFFTFLIVLTVGAAAAEPESMRVSRFLPDQPLSRRSRPAPVQAVLENTGQRRRGSASPTRRSAGHADRGSGGRTGRATRRRRNQAIGLERRSGPGGSLSVATASDRGDRDRRQRVAGDGLPARPGGAPVAVHPRARAGAHERSGRRASLPAVGGGQAAHVGQHPQASRTHAGAGLLRPGEPGGRRLGDEMGGRARHLVLHLLLVPHQPGRAGEDAVRQRHPRRAVQVASSPTR